MPRAKTTLSIPHNMADEKSKLESAALLRVEQLGILPRPIAPRKGNLNPPSVQGLGGNTYSDKTLAPLFSQPRAKKGEYSQNKWADTALVLVERAKKASQTYGKKDFNALYRLILSAGIAYDKAYPTQQVPTQNNLVVQLFGSLGSDTARRILEPPRPLIVEVTPQVDNTNDKPLDSVVDSVDEESPLGDDH